MNSVKKILFFFMLGAATLSAQGNEWCGYCRSIKDNSILHKYNLKNWSDEVYTTNVHTANCAEGILTPAYLPC